MEFDQRDLFLSHDFWIFNPVVALSAANWRSSRESDGRRSDYRCDFLGLFPLIRKRCLRTHILRTQAQYFSNPQLQIQAIRFKNRYFEE